MLRGWLDERDLAGLGDPLTAGAVARALVASGELDLPLPGSGRTRARWQGLAALGEADLVLARLAEGHLDAMAILAELHGPPAEPGELWGVWAAEPPTARVTARPDGSGGWWLDGTKAYCSGAAACGSALVTAADRLFAVSLRQPGVSVVAGTWPAYGMAGSDSRSVRFTEAAATPVGEPGDYLARPGFWHGAVGVATCWYGGAVGLARAMLRSAERRPPDAHLLAHLGAVDSVLTGMRLAWEAAADEIDADPLDVTGAARLRARRVRALVEAGAGEVMDRVGRGLGAAPLATDAAHSRRVADLTVYLRQSHAERDLADLGEQLLARGADW